MMNKPIPHLDITERALHLGADVQEWLSSERKSLEIAIRNTVDNGLFPHHDIQFALNHIKRSVTPEALQFWVSKVSNEEKTNQKNVLCLHAGNLPLVGFQDIVAVLLSGHRYFGKISRKDPFILMDFIQFLQNKNRYSVGICSTNLDDFSGLHADVLLFSGSESGAAAVQQRLSVMGTIHPETELLIRTAHASAVWFDPDLHGWDDLAEAIFRYEGRGCRSVAAIFTPENPTEVLRKLQISGDDFLKKNPLIKPLSPLVKYRFAYNQAIEKASVLCGNLLVECGSPSLKKDHVVSITKGSFRDALQFSEKAGSSLQTLYSNATHLAHAEPLSQAQTPPIYWKPDGVDPLDFLLRK